MPTFPRCEHNQKAFRCTLLTCQDIRKFHKNFYKCKTKLQQDNFILRYCSIKQAVKSKPNSQRKLAIKYTILCSKDGLLVPVCRDTFLNALQIKKDRVQGVMTRFYNSEGSPIKETRGGNRKSHLYEAKKLSVQWFIEKFKGQESHYCRSQTKRLYLPAGLNIRKMWRIYNDSRDAELKVKQSFFRSIFNRYYNIGFGTPRTDVCSTCISLQEQLKVEKDVTKRNELMIQKRIHGLKYKAFYSILKEDSQDTKTISFDCQKNQPLPKLPDQSAYFSRQFNFYHFAIVEGNSKAKLGKENVHSYYWNETTHAKGGNEIISAVYHFLQNVEISENIKVLRIVCDGCSGQNKNTGMISMLGKWLYVEAPRHLKKIELIFPIVGHSFIPPDRVFAKIEKTLKTKEVVTSPSEYAAVLQEHGSCVDLASIPVYDWKTAYASIIKPTTSWHFPFMKSKRFFITRTITENVLVQGEEAYRMERNTKKIVTKKNKKIIMIAPQVIQPNTIVPKASKLNDVHGLLKKHFGDEWKNLECLQYYKDLEGIGNNDSQDNERDDDECNGLCEPGFEEVAINV